MGKINVAWRVAMSTLRRDFTATERQTGWVEAFNHEQVAALQYPHALGETEKIRLEKDRASDILSACKNGELPNIKTSRIVKKTWSKAIPITFSHADYDGSPGKTHIASGVKEVEEVSYTVTASAFAAWLASQSENPSEHIAAWFEAVGVNTQPQPEALRLPTAPPATVTTQTTKHRNLLAPLVEAAQKACDSANDAAAVFTMLKTWAQESKPRAPLVGVTEDGRIQWRDSNETPKELDRKALTKRLQRQQKTPATTPPGKQLRRIK